MSTSTQVKFYRGKQYNPVNQGETGNNGEIVFLNDRMKDTPPANADELNQYNIERKLGSIWQDDKIVGTTRANELCLTDNIKVTNSVGNIVNGDTLQKGENIYNILSELLTKQVEYPSYEAAYASPGTLPADKGSISVSGGGIDSSSRMYIDQTANITYPTNVSVSATTTNTKYRNGGDTSYDDPANTTLNFYNSSTTTDTTQADLSYSVNNTENAWTATWGSKNLSLTFTIDKSIYGGPLLNTVDNKFYIPKDSNGTACTKTSKYDDDYSAVYAVDKTRAEERVEIKLKFPDLTGATKTIYGCLPYAFYEGTIGNLNFNPIKKSSETSVATNKKFNTENNTPTVYIPYKYKLSTNTDFQNSGNIIIKVNFAGKPYNFVINSGGSTFNTTSTGINNVITTQADYGRLTVVVDKYEFTNEGWKKFEGADATGKTLVEFLKFELVNMGVSTANDDGIKITIG